MRTFLVMAPVILINVAVWGLTIYVVILALAKLFGVPAEDLLREVE